MKWNKINQFSTAQDYKVGTAVVHEIRSPHQKSAYALKLENKPPQYFQTREQVEQYLNSIDEAK